MSSTPVDLLVVVEEQSPVTRHGMHELAWKRILESMSWR